jgi:hypothetical protein
VLPGPGERGPLDALVGTELSHYKLGAVLARGESGVIFRARDLKEGREVAVKVNLPEAAKSDAEAQRYLRTVKPVLGLRHPNLVGLYDADKTGAYCWTAMEYVEGEPLPQVVKRAEMGMLDWQHVLRVAVHLARALEFLHQRKIVHRSVVPRHILIKNSDKLTKLGGLAGARPLEDLQTDPNPTAGEYLRNLVYLPPERVRGDRHGDGRSDIYSLGATLYTLLTGRPPCASDDAEMPAIITQILQAEPPSPREFQPALPARFERVVMKMLAKRPDDRYQTPTQLLADLGTVTSPDAPEDRASPPPVAAAPAVTPGTIRVTCSCGQVLQAREKYAGTDVRCPVCGAMLHLPGKVDIRPMTEAFMSLIHPPPRATASRRPGEPGAAPASKLVTVVSILLVAGLTLLGILLWSTPKPSGPVESDPGKKAGPAEAGKKPAAPTPADKPTKS